MKSSLKIDYHVAFAEPVIKVEIDRTNSDDARDSLVRAFFLILENKSNWLKIEYVEMGNDNTIAFIRPIKPSDFESESKLMLDVMKAEKVSETIENA